jgi:hypothetical protein
MTFINKCLLTVAIISKLIWMNSVLNYAMKFTTNLRINEMEIQKNTVLKLIQLSLLSVLLGCVAMGGSPFVKDVFIAPDTAVLYVYRPMALQGIGECYKVGVDNKYLGCLKAGAHFRLEVEPSEHKVWETAAISSAGSVSECKSNAICKVIGQKMEGGKAYYVKVESFSFKFVEEMKALDSVSSTKGVHISR